MATAIASDKKNGKVTQVIGSTFDVEFPESTLPAIYNAVRIDADHKGVKLELVGEVQQHLGGGKSPLRGTRLNRWPHQRTGGC